MNNIHIEAVREQDLEILRALSIQTFVDTYAEFNTPENVSAYLSREFSMEALHAQWTDAQNQYFMAWSGEEAVGYLKCRTGKEPPELQGQNALEIQRIYVSGPFQQLKIGAKLLQQAIDYAQTRGFDALWLGVWEHNHKALAFYERWGFKVCGTFTFMFGEEAQMDYVMVKEGLRAAKQSFSS